MVPAVWGMADSLRWVMRAEPRIEVLAGDFRRGRATIDDDGVVLPLWRGGTERVPLPAISGFLMVGKSAGPSGAQKRFSGLVTGGLMGGAVGAAVSGGLATPIGAAVGATIGAFSNGGKSRVNCHVTLRDGRHFVAAGEQATWDELTIMLRMSQSRQMERELEAEVSRAPPPLPTPARRLPRLPFRRKD